MFALWKCLEAFFGTFTSCWIAKASWWNFCPIYLQLGIACTTGVSACTNHSCFSPILLLLVFDCSAPFAAATTLDSQSTNNHSTLTIISSAMHLQKSHNTSTILRDSTSTPGINQISTYMVVFGPIWIYLITLALSASKLCWSMQHVPLTLHCKRKSWDGREGWW